MLLRRPAKSIFDSELQLLWLWRGSPDGLVQGTTPGQDSVGGSDAALELFGSLDGHRRAIAYKTAAQQAVNLSFVRGLPSMTNGRAAGPLFFCCRLSIKLIEESPIAKAPADLPFFFAAFLASFSAARRASRSFPI